MKSNTIDLTCQTYSATTGTTGCNNCRWCELNRLNGPQKSKILDAYCNYQTDRTGPHQELKNRNPHIFRAGAYLNHNEQQVFTPNWCPVSSVSE